MFGFINVYKPAGITSHDVVSILRRITKIKQIGHTGTLDPFAEGVLPVCIGKATRLIEYLNDDKSYIGTVKLGESTTTFDSEGEILNKSSKVVTLDEINLALKAFQGEIQQIPPMYSAIKVNGKKLYDYARAGEQIEVKPRTVTISEINVLNYDKINRLLEIKISCSKGTYIRSIANDLGESLGTYGHLIKLVRNKAGDFWVENSVNIENIQSASDAEKYIEQPLKYLRYKLYNINQSEQDRVKNGNPLRADLPDGIVILTDGDRIAGIGDTINGIIKCKKVFL